MEPLKVFLLFIDMRLYVEVIIFDCSMQHRGKKHGTSSRYHSESTREQGWIIFKQWVLYLIYFSSLGNEQFCSNAVLTYRQSTPWYVQFWTDTMNVREQNYIYCIYEIWSTLCTLIETGGSANLIVREIASYLMDNGIQLEPTNQVMTMANSSSSCSGKLYHLSGSYYDWDAHFISDLFYDLMLGMLAIRELNLMPLDDLTS